MKTRAVQLLFFFVCTVFAAALQEYDAAVVVGEKTTGKGYFQTVIRLNDGSAVGLSVGKYFTPSGISLEGIGITPDKIVTVENTGKSEAYVRTIFAFEKDVNEAIVLNINENEWGWQDTGIEVELETGVYTIWGPL